jgi:hypothetical protein
MKEARLDPLLVAEVGSLGIVVHGRKADVVFEHLIFCLQCF